MAERSSLRSRRAWEPHGVTRKTGRTVVSVNWPNELAAKSWETLPRNVRNKVRDLMDEIADLIEDHR